MEYRGRKFPHFDHIGKRFFVTFRLENSIAVPVAKELKEERQTALLKIDNDLSTEAKIKEKNKIFRHYFQHYDALLDHPTYGDRYLSDPPLPKNNERSTTQV